MGGWPDRWAEGLESYLRIPAGIRPISHTPATCMLAPDDSRWASGVFAKRRCSGSRLLRMATALTAYRCVSPQPAACLPRLAPPGPVHPRGTPTSHKPVSRGPPVPAGLPSPICTPICGTPLRGILTPRAHCRRRCLLQDARWKCAARWLLFPGLARLLLRPCRT